MEEVIVFDLQMEEDVVALGWGMQRSLDKSKQYQLSLTEVAVDATCKR